MLFELKREERVRFSRKSANDSHLIRKKEGLIRQVTVNGDENS